MLEKPRHRSSRLSRWLPLLMWLGAGVSTAAVAQPASPESGWQFEATPYLWFPGTKGDSQIGNGPKIRIDQSPSEALEKLDSGLMATFEARKDRWALVFDGFHVTLSQSGSVSQPVAGVPVVVNGGVGVTQTILSAAGYYRLRDDGVRVDVAGGVRHVKFKMDAELSLQAQGQLLLTRNPEASESWSDPYVGVRVTMPIAERWSLLGYADIGGFGVGSDSTWQLQAGANREWSETLSSTFGYRVLHIDYDDGFRAKLDFSGVYVGLGVRF